MSIGAADLDRIAAAVSELGDTVANPAPVLRQRFPGVTFLGLDTTDFEGKPTRSTAHFELRLLDTRAHCVQLVEDPSEATAIVVTRRAEAGR